MAASVGAVLALAGMVGIASLKPWDSDNQLWWYWSAIMEGVLVFVLVLDVTRCFGGK